MNVNRTLGEVLLGWLERISVCVGDVIAIIVSTTISRSGVAPAARQENREATGMVVTSEVIWIVGALRVAGSTKFATPNNESVF